MFLRFRIPMRHWIESNVTRDWSCVFWHFIRNYLKDLLILLNYSALCIKDILWLKLWFHGWAFHICTSTSEMDGIHLFPINFNVELKLQLKRWSLRLLIFRIIAGNFLVRTFCVCCLLCCWLVQSYCNVLYCTVLVLRTVPSAGPAEHAEWARVCARVKKFCRLRYAM